MARNKKTRAIIHLDMDAFYPAVEAVDNPELKGQAVIVGGSRQRGVVSSASYEARKYGVHSAQPMAKAMRLCPHGVVLPVRMWRYQEVSAQVFEIFRRFTPLVEPLSIDEAFLDATGSVRLFGLPEEIARKIKESDFVLITRSVTLPRPTDDAMEIYSKVCSLVPKTGVGRKPVRLLGISMSQLVSAEMEGQLALFLEDEASKKKRELNTALDSIHEKFGDRAIRPGTLVTR